MGKKSPKNSEKSKSSNNQAVSLSPVETGHDDRANRRSQKTGSKKNAADAPDGVSGNWS